MFTTFSASPQYVRACDTCRRLKIKCRNIRPANGHVCDQCRKSRLKCTYDEQPARRGRPRRQDSPKSEEGVPKKVAQLRSPLSGHGPGGHHTDKLTGQSATYNAASTSSPAGERDSARRPPGKKESARTREFSVRLSPGPSGSPASHGDALSTSDRESPTNTSSASAETPEQAQVSATRWPQDAWDGINEFFDTLYIIFPVISYVELASRLILEPDWSASPDLRTIIYTLRLWSSAGNYRMGMRNGSEVRELIHTVETSRLTYDFADPATLDAVVCSLGLFTAHSVLGKHNRAMTYLSEAIVLLDAVVPTSYAEEERRLRLERILFNTESATLPIYASSVRRQAKRPPTQAKWEQAISERDTLRINTGLEGAAMHLVDRLTQIYLADDANELYEAEIDSEAVIETLFGTGLVRQHQYLRIQSADVVMTRQWQLSCKLASGSNEGSGPVEVATPASEALGVVAMSWICLLKEGDLRIVGLGKLVGLIMNICRLGGGRKHQDVLRGLVGAVMREDHEGTHYRPLAELVFPVLQAVPPSVGLQMPISVPGTEGIVTNPELGLLDYPTHVSPCANTELESLEHRDDSETVSLDFNPGWDMGEWLVN